MLSNARSVRDRKKRQAAQDGFIADERMQRLISAIAPRGLMALSGQAATGDDLKPAFSKARTNVIPPAPTPLAPTPLLVRSDESVSWTSQHHHDKGGARGAALIPRAASTTPSPGLALNGSVEARSRTPTINNRSRVRSASPVSAEHVAELHRQFGAALSAHGLTPASFVDLFAVPAHVAVDEWCKDATAHNATVSKIAKAFLRDCRDLRRHFVAACFSSGMALEEAARRLGLRLASLSLWLSTAPARDELRRPESRTGVGSASKTAASKLHLVPQDQCGLPTEAAAAAEHDSQLFSSEMLRSVWYFIVGVAQRHEAILRRADALSAVELSHVAKKAAEAAAEASRAMGRRVTVAPSVADASDRSPQLPPDHSLVSGVYLPPLRSGGKKKPLEVALPTPTSVFETSAINLAMNTVPDPLHVALEDAQRHAENVSPTAEKATRASDIATLAAVRRSAAAGHQRVVPLLVHDADGRLISRPREAERLRLRAKPHERDRYVLEQTVSDQRHRNLSLVHAPPSLQLLDQLEAQAWSMWGEEADEDDYTAVLRILGASPALPAPGESPGHEASVGGGLDAHMTAPAGLVVGGNRLVTPSQRMKPLVPRTLLQRASEEDGYRVVEHEGRRLATPTGNALMQCERTLLRLMVDRRIKGKHASELADALDPRNAQPLPLRPMLPSQLAPM